MNRSVRSAFLAAAGQGAAKPERLKAGLSYYSAKVKRELIGGVIVLALWIWRVVSGWRREQQERELNHKPRSWRDDAAMIVAAILVVVLMFVLIPANASDGAFALVFVAVLAAVYFLFHRLGELKRSWHRGHHNETPPSAER